MKRKKSGWIYTYAFFLLVASFFVFVAYADINVGMNFMSVVLMGIFMVLVVLASLFAIPISSRATIVVDTSVVFASLLLFPPPWAGVVTSLGVLIGLLLSRPKPLDLVINSSVRFIEVSVTQIIYMNLGGTFPPNFNQAGVIWAFSGAAIVYIFLDRSLISMAVALFQKIEFGRAFSSILTRAFYEDWALILIGILTALVVEVQPWTLLLAVIPVGIVYIALRNSLRLEVLTLEAVERMADVIDYRDPYTAGHSQRVAELAEKIAKAMGLPADEVRTVRAAARVHDLGKIAIDAGVLNKPGRLSDEEWDLMRRHPLLGAEIISRFPEFARGADYVRYHHERWDGKGYPFGLRGEEIPLGARIIAVADSYDAMATDRPYRKRLTQDVIMQEFRRGAGVQWDPQVVEAFLNVMGEKETKGEGPAPDRAWAPT